MSMDNGIQPGEDYSGKCYLYNSTIRADWLLISFTNHSGSRTLIFIDTTQFLPSVPADAR